MWFVLSAILALAAYSNAYPTGAPPSVCKSMTPGHGVDPKPGTPPYVVTTSAKEIKAGTPLEVTVSGNTPENTIRGIMLQARVGDQIVGTFEVQPDDPISRVMECDAEGDTITHKFHENKDDQQTVTYKWISPADFNDVIKFRATIVRTFKDFWVGVESAPIKVTL